MAGLQAQHHGCVSQSRGPPLGGILGARLVGDTRRVKCVCPRVFFHFIISPIGLEYYTESFSPASVMTQGHGAASYINIMNSKAWVFFHGPPHTQKDDIHA